MAAVPTHRCLALFLDGTWNTDDDNTNVFRLKSLCAQTPSQLRYYSKGVGTSRGQAFIGGAFGYGLDDEVVRAYQWLMENFQQDDRIYVFGFSRGAFTARSLCGLISKCGLLRLGSPLSLKQLYSRYRLGSSVRTIRQLANVSPADMSVEERWIKIYSQAIPIFFQGLWDTVGAIGVPFGHFPKVSRSQFAFLETDLRINYARAYHALAIDEHRKAFAPTLWKRTIQDNTDNYPARPLSDVEQRWFVGAHADVGGGYPDGAVSQAPARWILGKAILHGLTFTQDIPVDPIEATAPIHNSFAEMLHGWYRASKLFVPHLRTIGAEPVVQGHSSTETINETIDASVFERWRNDPTYRPTNLSKWASLRRVDCAAIKNTALALDASLVVPEVPH